MKNVQKERVLILTEKKFTGDKIREALSEVAYDVTIAEIGGHIYLDEESDILHVSEEELAAAVPLAVNDGTTAYVLDDDTIKKNAEVIKNLDPDSFDFILNACDSDDSGQLLFDYAASLAGFDPYPCLRMTIKDLTDDDDILLAFDVVIGASRAGEIAFFLNDVKQHVLSGMNIHLIVIRLSEDVPDWCLFACIGEDGVDTTDIKTAIYCEPYCVIPYDVGADLVLSLLVETGAHIEFHSEYFA